MLLSKIYPLIKVQVEVKLYEVEKLIVKEIFNNQISETI